MSANETRLALPILTVAIPAHVAGLAGVSRIDRDNRNAVSFRFVLDKSSQLREAPVAKHTSHGLGNRLPGPGTDVSKVLKSDSETLCLSPCDDVLTDLVVNIPLIIALSLGEFAKPLPAIASSAFLIGSSGASSPLAVLRNVGPGKALSRVSGSQKNDAQIDANEIARLNGWRSVELDRDEQEELALPVDKIGLAHLSLKGGLEVVATNKRHLVSSGNRIETGGLHSDQAIKPVVQRNRSIIAEDRANGLVAGKCFDRFADSPDRHLRWKTELFAKFPVAKMVDANLPIDLVVEPDPSRNSGSSIHGVHRIKQGFDLFGIRQQLNLNGQLHSVIVDGMCISVNLKGRQFLRRLKPAVSLTQIL